MKTVVSVQDLLEREIKPNALLAEYRRLTEESIAKRWTDGLGLEEVPCPGCGSGDSVAAFSKSTLAYRVCSRCESLFVSPRPNDASLIEYYRQSPAAAFWRDSIMAATAEARQEKLAEPRALWVVDTLSERLPDASRLADFSPNGVAAIEAVLRERPDLMVTAAYPTADLEYGGDHRLEIATGALTEPHALTDLDVILAFDSLDRTSDLTGLVRSARTSLRPGGLLFVTATCVSGFDLQVLWDRSAAIMPPDKLNLLSAEGWLTRFPAPDWEVLEFSTPGMFDVENVRRSVFGEPDADWPRFVRRLVAKDELARVEFQAYLQQFRLASFARLVIRRAE